MIITAADQATYPHFTAYVKNTLPKLITIPKIVQTIAKYGALDRASFQLALTWGTLPMIVITDLHAG